VPPSSPWSASPPTPTAGGGPPPTPTPRPGPTGLSLTSAAASLAGRLLFVADANLWLLERGQMRSITSDRVSRQPSWSRDGQRIALTKLWTSGADLWALDADGRNAQELTDFTYREDARQNYALRPIWAPDGTRLYFLSQEGTQDTQLWQVTLADRRRQRFLSHGERFGGIDHPRLSPDGRTLAVTSFQPGRGPTGRSQVWTFALPGGPWRQLTETPGGAYDPEWSPDGRLAYTVRTPDAGRSGGRHDVWVMRADGSGQRAITSSGLNRAPAWSPDGSAIAFLSARAGAFDVWLVSAPSDPASAASGSASPTAPPPIVARQITQNGELDADSGLAWAR
jgi:TolB protein